MILHFCFCYQWYILLDGNRGNCGLWMPGIYPALWQTAVPSCCLRRTALIVYSLEGHSVTVSRLPSSTGWVAKPQQESLQLTQVLLSCDQEDQDHALTVVWLARYRRQDPTVAIFPACEESQRLVVAMGNETALPCSDSWFFLSQGLTFPLLSFLNISSLFWPRVQFSSLNSQGRDGDLNQGSFFCLCSFFHRGKLLLIVTVTARIEFCFFTIFHVTTVTSFPRLSFLLLTKWYPCDRRNDVRYSPSRHFKYLNVPLFPFHYQNKYKQ